jgi:hypothetical protein
MRKSDILSWIMRVKKEVKQVKERRKKDENNRSFTKI